jgi:hypothetical protein
VIRSIALIGALVLVVAGPLCGQKKITNGSSRTKSAPKTPLAIYQKRVTDIIGSRWYASVRSKTDMITVGKLTMKFRILANGRVTGLKVLSNTSNEVFAQVCLAAVLESKFPPIPEAVRRQAHEDFIDWDGVNFIMYPD